MSVEVDPHSPRFATAASGLLLDFNLAGVLSAADVHVATLLGAIGGEEDEHDARRTLCILFERAAERFAESEPHHREADG